MKYVQTYEGSWYIIPWKNWRMRCCDCGLTHRLTFKKVGKKLFMVSHILDKSTATSRSKKKYKCRPAKKKTRAKPKIRRS